MQKRFKLKIRAGETFLYRETGTESQVFELRLKTNIIHAHLERAARLAYKRYPYFKSRFKTKDGNVYLCDNRISPPPQRLKKLRPLGGMATNKNLLDITYYKNYLYISFHHAMCDGRGIMQFIKTLMFYYLNFKYPHNNIRIPDVRLWGEGFLSKETADPVDEGNFVFDQSNVYKVDRTAFAIPEVQVGVEAGTDSWRYELLFNVHEVIKVCKAMNATPVILMTIFMHKAVSALNPNADKPILCNMSCDWRESIGLPNTFRNCVSSIYLPYGKVEEKMDMVDLTSHYRMLIAKQKQLDSARCNASVMKYMSDMLDSLETIEKKQEVVKNFTSKSVDSFVCSYTGKANMGDAEKYINEMHVYSSGTKGICLQMMSIADTFTVDFLQNFSDKLYVEEFIRQAKLFNLTIECSELIKYRTPKDKGTTKNRFIDKLKRLICISSNKKCNISAKNGALSIFFLQRVKNK